MIESFDTGVSMRLTDFNSSHLFRHILSSQCRPWEESAQDPETPNPVTPTKPPHNAGAGHYNQDAENSECQRHIAFVRDTCVH